ncbi:MAG: cysteine synthase A [Candidatus Sumerlaeota bacterium]|nr:cysteine synthase A [Candidatus Sumerlaeota bacterium]
MNAASSAIDLIGNTPLLRLARLCPGHAVYAKCEFMNPISVKDRPILQILQDAEREGRLKPGDTLIEATSGNTGMAVAWIGALRGYRAILVMSEIQSVERRQIMEAFGAQIVLTPAAKGTEGALQRLKEILAEHPEYFYVGQHQNPSNLKAHYQTTGPELWNDTDGTIDMLVAGLGTGGTLCGAGRFLKERNPKVQIIAVEPAEAPFISRGVFRPHRMMGTAPGFVPATLQREWIDEFFLVSEAEAFAMCRRLARAEGLLVGITSGAAAHAAAELAQRPANEGKTIVAIFPDSGQRYLSVAGLFSNAATGGGPL